ncbi:hypothetical protein F5B18DRAFT_663953 [Nemania serpens]|nr:hypothetical protein F5B18DRAFT_663953 [Nemania serpens]
MSSISDSINTNFQLASWRDGNGGFFVLSAATTNTPPSETQPLSGRGEIRKVHDAGGVSAVWRVGEAFVKLKETISSHATKEHTTLEYLRDRQPLNFHIPDVHYHADLGNRYLIVLGGLAGRTLNDAWDEMDDTTRQECVSRIASICMELTTWEGDIIGGVDGKQLTNQYLLKSSAEMNFNPCNLLKNCKEMGMDCSSLEWVRTKFRCSSGLDLSERAGGNTPRTDWRRRVSQELERLGFSDVVQNWLTWHFSLITPILHPVISNLGC